MKRYFYATQLVLALSAQPTFALTSADYLHVSTSCPQTLKDGLIIYETENIEGHRGRRSFHFKNNILDSIEEASSTDGRTFQSYWMITRATSEHNGDMPLIRAFEAAADEIMRLYCSADVAARGHYDAILAANRQRLAKQARR